MSENSSLPADLANSKMEITEILKKHKVHEINQGRSVYGEYHHLFPILRKYGDRFKEYTRMEMETFDYILCHIERYLKKDWCNLHKQAIYPEEQLVVTLRFLATGMTYADLAFTFRMAKATICGVVKRVMDVLWKILYPIHMPVPTEEKFLEIAEEFHKLGKLPHCLGAIDVRHIRIKKPAHGASKWFNYKRFNSMVLQGIVDGNSRYISIDVGGYGRQHDSTTFKASSFYAALERNLVKLPKADELPGAKVVVPYFFVGDGAYPLMQHLMKPYPGEQLLEDHKTLNSWISSTRMVVERTFGQDCQRWHIYYKPIECSPKTIKLIAKTTCVLHNLIIDLEKNQKEEKANIANKDQKRKHTEEAAVPLVKIERPDESDEDVQCGFPIGNGRDVREKLMTYLMEQKNKK